MRPGAECMLQEFGRAEMAAPRSAAWRAHPERAASPKMPRSGNLGPAKADDSSWDSSDPVCLGIAELSRHGIERGAVCPTPECPSRSHTRYLVLEASK